MYRHSPPLYILLELLRVVEEKRVEHTQRKMKNSVSRYQAVKKYEHIPITDNLPLGIGAQFHDDPINRNTQRKSHNLLLERRVKYAPHTEYLYSGEPNNDRKRFSGIKSQGPVECIGLDSDEDADIWEGWFTEEITDEDKKEFVVRILAYFTERVLENPDEEERVRKVMIKYFVKDDSISITEAKTPNSGMEQKTILSRRRVPKDKNSLSAIFKLEDFRVGETIKIYDQPYHIIDMDKRSRRYFREVRHEEVPPPLPCPEDAYGKIQRERLGQTTRRAITSDDMDRKRVVEQQLTGIYTKHSNEDIVIAKQFLKNRINEHLSFLALWDDRGNLSGDLHFCVLRVFLENYAIEVAENRPENSGRSGGPILISRQRIPKPGTDLTKSRYQEHTYGKLMKTDYLCPEDFQIGETYDIFGKPFYLYNCDDYTRKYMKEHFNVDLKGAIDITPFIKDVKKKVIFYPPPPNGFGSEKENVDNWLALNIRAAKPNQEKALLERGRIMNFAARLANPLVKGDETREFVITFYRETGELEIQEKAARNTGFIGGRFLAKGKHRKDLPDGSTEPFTAEDFEVGKTVYIYSRPFHLLGMDACTKRILEGTDNTITEEKIKDYIVSLKKQMKLKYESPKEAFMALAPQGTLGYRQIKEFLRSCSCDISDDEAVLIVQNLSPESHGVISYEAFLDIQQGSGESMDGAALSTKAIGDVNMQVNSELKDAAQLSEDRHRRRVLQTLLQQKLVQRKVAGNTLQEQFRVFAEHSATCRMTREAFRRSLNELMHFNVSKKDEDMLVSLMFDRFEDENGEITYQKFQDFVDCLEDL